MKKGIILVSGILLLTLCSGCAALAQYGDVITKAAYGIAKYVFSHEGGKLYSNTKETEDGSAHN